METINDRMEMLINERFNGNKAAFAKTIGLPPTGLSNYLGLKRRSKPSVDMVTKIVVKLNVDARWLLTGEQPKSESSVQTTGAFSPASMHGDVSVTAPTTATASDTAVLEERIKSLEALITEKERLIQVLLTARADA